MDKFCFSDPRRREISDIDGKVKYTRTSATKDSVIRAAPEGLIDPMVSLISFWNNDKVYKNEK